MPRRPRGELRGEIHHILNRGNNRATIFHDEHDFAEFLTLLERLKHAYPTRIYAFCLMSNHFHAIAEPRDIDTMSAFMHQLMRGYTIRHHTRYETCGRLWQDRYKAFPIERDEHFLTAVRYVLRNPVRAKIVSHPRDYEWSSLAHANLIHDWPVERPSNFERFLGEPLPNDVLSSLRTSINRQIPFGSPRWVAKTSKQLGITTAAPPNSVTGTVPEGQTPDNDDE